MVKAPLPFDESIRLRHLYDYEILDTPDEEDFDEIVSLAAHLCHTPYSLITLADTKRIWLKAKKGTTATESSRDTSFCGHAILKSEILVVSDATLDERFHDNPHVTGETGIRFYAGVPLVSPHGACLGTLCVFDLVPRELGKEQRDALTVLGKQVVRLMDLHKAKNDLKRLVRQEKIHLEERERIADAKSKIVAVLSGDLRNSLGSLTSLLQLIPDKTGGLAQSGLLLERAGGQLKATLSLVDNLTGWAQLQLHTGDPESREFRVFEVVRQLTGSLEKQAGEKGLILKNLVHPDMKIVSNEGKVRFILRNLLTNAIKFTESGQIAVDAVLTQKAILICVEDSGIGIPPGMLEQLFQEGRKISRKGTQNEAGSGLGLIMIKELTDQMMGKISVESEEGRGTVIAVCLPRFPEGSSPRNLFTPVEKLSVKKD